MTTPIDLDALDREHAISLDPDASQWDTETAVARIVAAYPALAARIRELEAEIEAHSRECNSVPFPLRGGRP